MYSIHGLSTVFDVMAYTVAAMKQAGFMPGEIEDYVHDAVKDNCNLTLIEISKERLEECNKTTIVDNGFEDTWRDHYYSSLWDDSEDTYDYMIGNKKTHNIWDDDNVFNDLKSDDEEAYEGFSSCKNYRWDSTDDDWDIGSHYLDKMK